MSSTKNRNEIMHRKQPDNWGQEKQVCNSIWLANKARMTLSDFGSRLGVFSWLVLRIQDNKNAQDRGGLMNSKSYFQKNFKRKKHTLIIYKSEVAIQNTKCAWVKGQIINFFKKWVNKHIKKQPVTLTMSWHLGILTHH